MSHKLLIVFAITIEKVGFKKINFKKDYKLLFFPNQDLRKIIVYIN